jgi:hypothetical protein
LAVTDTRVLGWRLGETEQVTAAQLFTVTYANTYKYVQDLRSRPPKTYVLYQARGDGCRALGRPCPKHGV